MLTTALSITELLEIEQSRRPDSEFFKIRGQEATRVERGFDYFDAAWIAAIDVSYFLGRLSLSRADARGVSLTRTFPIASAVTVNRLIDGPELSDEEAEGILSVRLKTSDIQIESFERLPVNGMQVCDLNEIAVRADEKAAAIAVLQKYVPEYVIEKIASR